MIDYYADLVATSPIILLEDPFEEEAYDHFAKLTARLPNTIIVGDDIDVTNPSKVRKGIEMRAAIAL